MTDAELVQWAIVCLRSTKQNPDTVNKLVELARKLEEGVIVPREPTRKMLKAGANQLAFSDNGSYREDAADVYHAMLQAQEEQG